MALQLRDVPAPVFDGQTPRQPWDQAVDAATRRAEESNLWLGSFQNDAGTRTHRQMMGDAMSYAAAQTQPQTIRLEPGDYDFSASATTGWNVYPGFAIAGPSDAGLQTIEQTTKGAKCRVLVNVGSGTQSLFYANTGGSIYNPMTVSNIAWRSTNNVSQWLHAPLSTTNLYGATMGNLEFTGFKHVIGMPGDAATITLFTMWGAWNIPNMADVPLSFRGSDNWLVPDECNIGWNAAPAGKYLVRLENVQKTFLRGFYLTCRVGGSRAILVDNQGSQTQGGLFISDCVIEGQNLGEPAGGALIYVNSNGVVSVHDIAFNFAMGNPAVQSPADTAYIMAALSTYGVLNVHDVTVTRATGVSQNVPIVAQTGGGRCYVNRIFGMPGNGGGQLWTDLPAVSSSAGYMEIDATVRVV